MVLKRQSDIVTTSRMFENDVKMYGTQACGLERERKSAFENDVKMYGTQADCHDNEFRL